METTKSIIESILHFWEWILAGFGLIFLRFAGKRVIKSYTQEIEQMRKDITELQQADFLSKNEFLNRSDRIIKDVQSSHDRIERSATEQYHKQREDFKHLENRIDDTNRQIKEVYQILVEKLH